MGIFDRIRDAVGGDRGRRSPDAGVDRGAGTGRGGTGDGEKTGSHGSHWDALVPDNATVRAAVVTAVEDGDVREGTTADGRPVTAHVHPATGPVRTVALSVDGEVVTAFPVGDGVTHEVTVTDVVPWANGVEAQVTVDCGEASLGAFDTGYFFRDRDWYDGSPGCRMNLAAFAYDLEPVTDSGSTDDGDLPAFVRFDGGDVDDYVFRTRIEAVEERAFRGRTVYRCRAPLARSGGEAVTVAFYAADHVIGGYRPRDGDEVEGVCWLQGRAV